MWIRRPLHVIPTMGAVTCLLVSVAFAQDVSIQERVRTIVEERYVDAPEGQRAVVVERLLAVLLRNPAVSQVKLEGFVGQLDLAIQHVRSYVRPHDPRALGDSNYPPLPDSLKRRQFDLELQWLEVYFRKGTESKPVSSGDRESITRQVDYLLAEARSIMHQRVTGPFALEAIDGKLQNIRQHLLGTFEGPVSSDFPRLMTAGEVNGIVDKIREGISNLRTEIEVTESLQSLRQAMRADVADEEGRQRRSEIVRKYKEISGAIDGMANPLWQVFDIWTPEVTKTRAELEQLSKEVQAWRLETIDRMNREGREKMASPNLKSGTPSNTKVEATATSKASESKENSRSPKAGLKGKVEKGSDSETGSPWILILSLSLVVLLMILGVLRYARGRVT